MEGEWSEWGGGESGWGGKVELKEERGAVDKGDEGSGRERRRRRIRRVEEDEKWRKRKSGGRKGGRKN